MAKRAIQKHLRGARRARPRGQTGTTFLRNQAKGIWAGDFLQTTDLAFRPLFAFFIVEHATCRVVHLGLTRHPTDAWVAHQLREVTPFDQKPRLLIRDNDATIGPACAQVAEASGIRIVRTPVRAPRANAIGERFLASVRRECRDYVLILGERHLHLVLRKYLGSFNRGRPQQGLQQAIPEPPTHAAVGGPSGSIHAVPVRGGLHDDYQRAAYQPDALVANTAWSLPRSRSNPKSCASTAKIILPPRALHRREEMIAAAEVRWDDPIFAQHKWWDGCWYHEANAVTGRIRHEPYPPLGLPR